MRSEYADGDADVVNSTLCASGGSGINWQCLDVFALHISSYFSMSARSPLTESGLCSVTCVVCVRHLIPHIVPLLLHNGSRRMNVAPGT